MTEHSLCLFYQIKYVLHHSCDEFLVLQQVKFLSFGWLGSVSPAEKHHLELASLPLNPHDIMHWFKEKSICSVAVPEGPKLKSIDSLKVFAQLRKNMLHSVTIGILDN